MSRQGQAVVECRAQDARCRASRRLERAGLLVGGHFDYGNGCHGTTALDVSGLFRFPPLTWRVAEDLLDVIPWELRSSVDVVAGAGVAGGILAHVIAGLLDGRRRLDRPACRFVAFERTEGQWAIRDGGTDLRSAQMLLVDHWQPRGEMLDSCAALARSSCARVVSTRLAPWPGEPVSSDSLLFTLCDALERHPISSRQCPSCRAGLAATMIGQSSPVFTA